MQDSKSDNVLDPYMSRKELAAHLGKQHQTLIAWEKNGLGPPITRIGRSVFYNRSSVIRWIQSLESNPAEAE